METNNICKKCNSLGFFVETDNGIVCMYCGTPIENVSDVFTDELKKKSTNSVEKKKQKTILKPNEARSLFNKLFKGI